MKVRSLIVLLLVLVGVALALLFIFPGEEPRPVKKPAFVEEKEPLAEEIDYLAFQTPLPVAPADNTREILIPLPSASEHAIPGEFTLFFEDAAGLEAFVAEAEDHGLTVTGVIPELLAVRLSGAAGDLAPLLQKGMSVDNNYRMRAPTVPDTSLWQESNLRAFEARALEFLEAPDSDDRMEWGQGVTIAILDTGWAGHPAVEEGRVRQIDLLGTESAGALEGHGTAVAGLIGSRDPLAPGIAPGSDILAIRVLDDSGQGNAFTLAEGILTAVEHGARVINLSLGGYGNSRVLRKAIDYAIASGAAVVAASGNDGSSVATFPAAYPDVIGVTAVDANGNRTPFANYGEGIDLAAPGYQVHALWEEDSYVLFDGTSASAPLVSGMVARILEKGYAETPEAVQSLLRELANDTGLPGDDPQYGAGLLNARRIEESIVPGIYDIALADLYPATEESNGTTFPVYVTFENRGTEFLPGATVEIAVNGTTSYYRLTGVSRGQVESIPIPIDQARLEAGNLIEIQASVGLSDRYSDAHPANNRGSIRLSSTPAE